EGWLHFPWPWRIFITCSSEMGYPFSSTVTPWQRDQNQREANAESFLIDTGFGEASNCLSLRTFDQRCYLCPGVAVTGDSEKSRSRSVDDESILSIGRKR